MRTNALRDGLPESPDPCVISKRLKIRWWRADDAYSALDYLIEKKLAKPDEVYVIGYSNGGTRRWYR